MVACLNSSDVDFGEAILGGEAGGFGFLKRCLGSFPPTLERCQPRLGVGNGGPGCFEGVLPGLHVRLEGRQAFRQVGALLYEGLVLVGPVGVLPLRLGVRLLGFGQHLTPRAERQRIKCFPKRDDGSRPAL